MNSDIFILVCGLLIYGILCCILQYFENKRYNILSDKIDHFIELVYLLLRSKHDPT